MKLQVLQEELARIISIAAHFTSQRAQLPVLANVLLFASKTKLNVSATNLEMSINLSLGAKTEEEGKITVPARTLSDIVTNLNPGTIELSSQKEELTITADNYHSVLAGVNASDFPSIPSNIKMPYLSFSNADFFEALSKVLFAVSQDETRPVLTGVLILIKNGQLTLVSTDGFRLSKKNLKDKYQKVFEKIILPRAILGELPRLVIDNEKTDFAFEKKDNQAIIKVGNAVVSSRVIEGEFPDFEKIIPKSASTKVSVEKESISKAVKLASVFARDSANIIKLIVGKNSVEILAESKFSGKQKNSIEAKVEGNPLEIAFNYKFIEDFIQSIKGDDVVMEFSGANSPGVFLEPSDKDYLHLIMPIKT